MKDNKEPNTAQKMWHGLNLTIFGIFHPRKSKKRARDYINTVGYTPLKTEEEGHICAGARVVCSD